MSHTTMTAATLFPNVTIGLDLGDRTSATYELDAAGACQREATVPTTPRGLTRYFADRPPARVVYEVGTHSPWVTRLLTALGHEVVVANPSAMFAGAPRRRRSSRIRATGGWPGRW